MPTDQTRRTDARLPDWNGVVRVRVVDRPAPEDFMRFFTENLCNAKSRGREDATVAATRRLKDEVVSGYFVVG